MSIATLRPVKTEAIRVQKGLRHRAADEGIAALMAAEYPIYQRDRSLVRAAKTKAKSADGDVIEAPAILPVTLPFLARALGSISSWEKLKADGTPIRIDPPSDVVEQIAAMAGEWPFYPLAGVIGTPTMRPDGSLLLEEGYDEATGLYLLSPPTMPPLPDSPEKDDAEAALAELSGLLAEFPFTDRASRSVALSMMLTTVLRGALAPAVPMHVVTAPQPGTGKSYLLDTVAALATGERCPVIAMAPQPEETEKRLVGAALAGLPIIAIDNVNDILTGDFLAQVTERPILQIRALGASSLVKITNTFTVFANGNNITATADLVRRTLRCGLDADLENPEERQYVSDPVASVLADRGNFVAACLTIARAYILAEQPDRPPRLPSFPAWSDLVRGALLWLGEDDPVASMNLARAEDPVRQARTELFTAWVAELGCNGDGHKTAELIELANQTDFDGLVRPRLHAALIAVARDRRANTIDAARLGNWLRHNRGNRVGTQKLIVSPGDPARPRWLITDQ